MKNIYLAGPLTSLSYNQSESWRNYVREKIPSYIETKSPLRGLEHLKEKADLKHTYGNHPLSTAKGLTMKDYNDVDNSDGILVNFLGANKVSIGSVMEIARAASKLIPVVCVMEDDNIHQHPMLNQGCLVIVKNLDEGIDMLISIISTDQEMILYKIKKEVHQYVMDFGSVNDNNNIKSTIFAKVFDEKSNCFYNGLVKY